MRSNRLHLLIVGTLLSGAAALVMWQPSAHADEKAARDVAAQPAADRTSAEARPLALPPGVTQKDLNESGDIRNAFEVVTEQAFDNDDAFDNIVNRLVDADRNRIAAWRKDNKDFKALHARIDLLRRQWKDKYGKDFGDIDEKTVFGAQGFVAIATGEIADPAQLVGKWPVQPVMTDARTAGEKQPAAPADTAQQVREAGKPAGGDVNLEKGRNVAVAQLPAGHGMPAIDASLIHENPDVWRFDIPDTVDGKRLHDTLLHHLTMLGDGSNWPTDMNEGYRMVAHHVLMALYDVPDPSKAGAASDAGKSAANR